MQRLVLRQLAAINSAVPYLIDAIKLLEQRRNQNEERYLSNLDGRIPFHHHAKLVCCLLAAK